jgi:UDP-4-amino-4,6-dideoxy-N-acetyl-beta-L-altrosamine transaminase
MFIPYGRQNITQNDIDDVIDVLNSDWLTQGPMVQEFEEKVAKTVGADHGVATNSATSALHVACLALGLKPGDSLWTSPNTFVSSANCALFCGASVDFVDIDHRTYNMSIDHLRRKLELARENRNLPKIVIPVHYAGQSCEMKEIYELSRIYNFKIIEDASHAIGGKYLKKHIGNCKYSDITIFSFHPVKIITTAEGGMALTNNSSYAEKMHRLRTHGITRSAKTDRTYSVNEIWNYHQVDLGFNYRMNDIQAALGVSQLSRLKAFIDTRSEIAQKYNSNLIELPITLPAQDKNTNSSYHLYPIRIQEKYCKVKRNEVYDGLRKQGIGVNVHYIPVYRHPYYKALGFPVGYCPEAESFFKQTLSLPIFPGLKVEELRKIIDALKDLIL